MFVALPPHFIFFVSRKKKKQFVRSRTFSHSETVEKRGIEDEKNRFLSLISAHFVLSLVDEFFVLFLSEEFSFNDFSDTFNKCSTTTFHIQFLLTITHGDLLKSRRRHFVKAPHEAQ